MHINHRYLLSWAAAAGAANSNAKILDYGCGKGEVVRAARERGLDVFGAEVLSAQFRGRRRRNSGYWARLFAKSSTPEYRLTTEVLAW